MEDEQREGLEIEHIQEPAAKRRYETPRLEVFGDVRDLTLGRSTGVGESTGSGLRKGGPGTG